MAERYTDQQRQIVREILQAAMHVFRDNVSFVKLKAVFGENWDTEDIPGTVGKRYSFSHPQLPRVSIRLDTNGDPADFRADRSKVDEVPVFFEIHFTPLLDKLAIEELERLLQLKVGSYQFSESHVVSYNRFLPDPLTPFAEPYRYQALEVPGSKFPVDVELDYIRPGAQPPEQGGLTSTVLAEVRIKRDYPVLTREERKARSREMPVSLRQRYGPLPMSGDMCHATGKYVPIFPDGRHYTHRFTGSSVFRLSADMLFPKAPVWNSATGQDEWQEVWWQHVG